MYVVRYCKATGIKLAVNRFLRYVTFERTWTPRAQGVINNVIRCLHVSVYICPTLKELRQYVCEG